MVKKIVRYSLITLAWAMGILLAIWIIFWIYVSLNQQMLKDKVAGIIHERTKGDVIIGKVSVSLLRTFPILSLKLTRITIRDSLYSFHKLDLLDASEVYLKVSLPGLLKGQTPIGKIIINDGKINLITDSSGRTNEFVLKSPKGQDASGKRFPNLVLRNVFITYSNPVKKKLYIGLVRNLKCDVKQNDSLIKFYISADVHLNGLSFSTKRGAYLKDKNVNGSFLVGFNVATKELFFNNTKLNVEGHPYVLNGSFRFNPAASGYTLVVSSRQVDYNNTLPFLNDTIEKRLKRFSFSKPLNIKVTVTARSLYHTPADVRIQSEFDLDAVKKFAGITFLDFVKGKGSVDISVISSNLAKDTVNGDLDGSVRITDAAIRYKPRNFLLANCVGLIRFNNNDILIDTLSGRAGETQLVINGQTKNLFTLGNGNPGKLKMYSKVTSPLVHLKDFIPFLSRNSQNAGGSIDKMFTEGDIYVILETPKLIYKNFTATNVHADGVLKATGVELQKVAFNHAHGSIELTASIENGTETNPVFLHTKMRNLDIPQLFSSFSNFGQDAITDRNLKGRITADIIYKTSLTNKADLITPGSKGTVDFILQDGELNHFEPLEEVAKKAFKKQDFSEIRFADLKNKLQVAGTSFIINPMEIRSTAITLFVEGIYDYKNGTDMSIQLPLRNLTKNQANVDLSDEVKTKKGISVRLRAKTGEDKKLKVTWDPFRKAIRNKQEVKESTETKNVKNRPVQRVEKDSSQAKK